jgi:hypothetical protein
LEKQASTLLGHRRIIEFTASAGGCHSRTLGEADIDFLRA